MKHPFVFKEYPDRVDLLFHDTVMMSALHDGLLATPEAVLHQKQMLVYWLYTRAKRLADELGVSV